MSEKWPSLRRRKLKSILERLCGPPRPGGEHPIFDSPRTGRQFTYGYHDRADVHGNQVRRILVTDVGLTVEQARREVS